jgi:hypothetical protein
MNQRVYIEHKFRSEMMILYFIWFSQSKILFWWINEKYFDILYSINMYKFDNPDYDFQNISNDYSFETKILSY